MVLTVTTIAVLYTDGSMHALTNTLIAVNRLVEISYGDGAGEPLPSLVVHVGTLVDSQNPRIFITDGAKHRPNATFSKILKKNHFRCMSPQKTSKTPLRSLSVWAFATSGSGPSRSPRTIRLIGREKRRRWEESLHKRVALAPLSCGNGATNRDQDLFLPRGIDLLAARISYPLVRKVCDYTCVGLYGGSDSVCRG